MNPCCTTTPAPRIRNASALVTLFQALSDPTRLRILALLAERSPGEPGGEVCVCHIHDSLNVTQSAASRHLAYLRRAGLVSARRNGVWMHYRIERPADPVLASVFDAALHALDHTATTPRDRAKLIRVVTDAEVAATR